MKELIERLRYPVLCTLTDRIEAADALERLTLERNELRAKYDEVEAAAAEAESCMHYRGVALERLTAERDAAKDEIERLTEHDQFLADANKQWVADCARLTAELNSIKEKNAPEIEKCNSYIANLTAERNALAAYAAKADIELGNLEDKLREAHAMSATLSHAARVSRRWEQAEIDKFKARVRAALEEPQ